MPGWQSCRQFRLRTLEWLCSRLQSGVPGFESRPRLSGIATGVEQVSDGAADADEVVAAVPYHPDREEFLVVKRSDGKEVYPGKWEFPAGYIEDEDPADAAIRELEEEAGIVGTALRTGDPHTVDGPHGRFRVHPVLVMVRDDAVTLTAEHTEHRWMSAAEVVALDAVDGLRADMEAVDVEVEEDA